MSTLIYHSGALGDFITTLPAIAWWKRLFPGPVTLLGKTEIGNLAVNAGYIDEVIDADSSRYLYLFNELTGAEQLPAFFQRFDALLLFADNRSGIVINTRRHFSGKLFCQPPLPAGDLHAVDYHLSLFPDSAPEPSGRIPAITVTHPPRQPLLPSTGGRRVIALHPGSGGRLKNGGIRQPGSPDRPNRHCRYPKATCTSAIARLPSVPLFYTGARGISETTAV